MEEKYQAYKRFDWASNEKWQAYLKNIYPVPPADRLEKVRRKWYKANVDKLFDVDFSEG